MDINDIETELKNKTIERVKIDLEDSLAPPTHPEGGAPAKAKAPKKERTKAQKDAFEKARKKRADNLAKKKEQQTAEEEEEEEEVLPEIIKPPPKKRGRPRKKKEEPPAPHFIPPQQGAPQNYYPTQGQQYPWGALPLAQAPPPYWHQQYQLPQQREPVVNNYYYGAAERAAPATDSRAERQRTATPEPVATEHRYSDGSAFEEESSEEEYVLDPRLKFRFA